MGARYRYRSGGNANGTWRDRAQCKGIDPSTFYPDPSDTALQALAKSICAMCTVREDCLEHAMGYPEREGVWGGYSEDERKRLRRARTRAANNTKRGIA